MDSTILIALACVFGSSILLAIPFMLKNKKTKEKEKLFVQNNRDKAIVNLYCSKTVIDGADVACLNSMKGAGGQRVVVLESGTHSFEGVFETTEIGMTGKNVNYKTGKLKFDIPLEAGHTYSLGIYLYSPEQRKSYYKGDVGVDIFTLPLDIEGRGSNARAYVICYQED